MGTRAGYGWLGLLVVVGLSACDGGSTTPNLPRDTDPSACDYPAGAASVMAVGEVLAPYSWPKAIGANGAIADLDLGLVPCAVDPDIDWSPFDVLLFVSLPAW